jgi:hypothetical protein
MNLQLKKWQTLEGNYRAYYSLVNSGKEQPQTTHGDRYDENRPYSISLMLKGVSFVTIKLRDWINWQKHQKIFP